MTTTHIVPSSLVQPDLNPTEALGLRISDWMVLILFFGFFVVTVVPLGRFMVRVIKGEPHFLTPISAPVEHRILTWSQVNAEDEMDWKTFAICDDGLFVLRDTLPFCVPVCPTRPATQSCGCGIAIMGSCAQYRSKFCYQHQLAGLCRGDRCQLSHPDDGPVRPELHVGCYRTCGTLSGLHSVFPGGRASTIGNFWVLLVRSIMILLPISIIIALILVSQGTVQTLQGPVTVPLLDPLRMQTGRSDHHPDNPAGSCCIADCDQTAGCKRGRFLQCELRPPV